MLPWPNGMGTSDLNRRISNQRTENIRHEAVGGPIASSDNVASSHGGKCHTMLWVTVGMKERFLIRGEYEFDASFATAVRIVAA